MDSVIEELGPSCEVNVPTKLAAPESRIAALKAGSHV